MVLSSLVRDFTTDTSDALVTAQVEAFRQRIPILYVVLAINTVALSVTFRGLVPDSLSTYLPTIFVVVMLSRAVYWYMRRALPLTPAEARRAIRSTTVFAGAMSVTLLVWAALLYSVEQRSGPQVAGVREYGHIVIYIGLTVVSCVALMMHVKAAAIGITLLVIPPFCLFLTWNGSSIEWAVAINLALVGFAMLYVVMVSARDFKNAVESKDELSQMHGQQVILANTDSLTGLDNRRRFYATLEGVVNVRRPFAVIMVDLDGFKQVNDVHGHMVGDHVLREIAGRLADAAQGTISTARVGGDEFAVLVTGPMPTALLVQLANRIVEVCSLPVKREGLAVSVGASVGINEVDGAALDEPHTRHVERADYALFHVKQSGRGGVEVYTPEHEARIKRKGLIEQTLRGARLTNELHILYQPIVLARTQTLQGFEALVRWQSPTLGSVQPGEFIPIAERSDLIFDITRFVLEQALKQARQWPSTIRLKVNLSARDLASPGQMLFLLKILQASGVDARRLTFEITETAFGENREVVRSAVNLLKSTGAAVAVDDFGTGYSSLSTIHCLCPDLIKIDRSFIMRIGDGTGAEGMIKTIIEMCRNMGARSLAEGVEEASQVDALTKLGCDELQGYWFSRPVDALSTQKFVRHVRPLDAMVN